MAYPTTGRHMSITISPLRSVRAVSVLINATMAGIKKIIQQGII